MRGEPGRSQRGCAQDDLSPARDCGEVGGALHGVADETKVGGRIGSEIRGLQGRDLCGPVVAAQAVVAGIGHCEDRIAEGSPWCQVLCVVKLVPQTSAERSIPSPAIRGVCTG